MVSDVLSAGLLPEGETGFKDTGRYYAVEADGLDRDSRTARVTRFRVERGRLLGRESFVEGPLVLVGADLLVIDGLTREVRPSRDKTPVLRRIEGSLYRFARGEGPLSPLRQTEYFKRRVLGERPYIDLAWCEATVRAPEATEVQSDGRCDTGGSSRSWGSTFAS